ncbi:MAG: hypothetical protein ACE5HU_01660 [Acidobacteriota bacterium]
MSLTLTPPAIDKLITELEHKRSQPGEVFRLLADPSGGFGLLLDTPTPEDNVLRHEGTLLLVVHPALDDQLADAVFDVGQRADEPEWVLVRGGAFT